MGTREGDEADIESLVTHSTEGNRLHEYFMGFVCILPHIHNMIVLLDFFFLARVQLSDIWHSVYFKYTEANCAHTEADKCRAITMAISDCLWSLVADDQSEWVLVTEL